MIRVAAIMLVLAGLFYGMGGSRPAWALSCLDLQTGTIRDSGEDSCRLGERQNLPELSPPTPPAQPRHAERCPTGSPSVAAIIRQIRDNLGPPAAEAAYDTSEAGWRSAVTTSLRHSLRFGADKIVVETIESNHHLSRKDREFQDETLGESSTATARLDRLSPQVLIERETRPHLDSWSRLTLSCISGKCWTLHGRYTQETESPTAPRHSTSIVMPARWSSVSFLVETPTQAAAVADALSKLIGLCRGDQPGNPTPSAPDQALR